MRKTRFITSLMAFLVATFTLTSCLHVVEEITMKNNGSGSYTMKIDMSEMKSMLDMLKGMGEGEEGETAEEGEVEEEVGDIVVDRSKDAEEESESGGMGDTDPSKIGEEFANVAEVLKKVKGLKNVASINDTSAFNFGYSFDFEDVASLNKALELVNKEKFDAKAKDVYVFSKKKLVRTGSANFGEELKRTLSESDDEEGSMDMVKMFFADMTYKQIYHFERKIKSSSNKSGEISNDGHTLTVSVKPFSEDTKSTSIANEIKLK